MKHYDTIVIGAGIAGCCAARALQEQGQRVLIVDRSSMAATGGSGAAGAFVSPKIGKGGPLQQLTNEAYTYAKRFYRTHFPDYFHQTGVIRIPKDTEDATKFVTYEPHNEASYRWVNADTLKGWGITQPYASFLFEEAGVCDAPELCNAILSELDFRQFGVERVERVSEEAVWRLYDATGGVLHTKAVVLATGYEQNLLALDYMGIRGTWGSRGDYYSQLSLDVSMHKKISVSANIDGVIKLGATHVKSPHPCRVCDGRPLVSLEAEAKTMVDTSDFRLKETFCGMRAGSRDYFPLVGRVVDLPAMVTHHPTIFRGAKPPLRHLEDLYILNGVGGRGFVFAPLMAAWLATLIVEGTPIDPRVNPDRLFLKWARKQSIS